MLVCSPYFIIKKLQIRVFKRHCHFVNGKVLDIGCGLSPYKEYLISSVTYVGMDQNAVVRPRVSGKAEALPFQDGIFDSVLCAEVLEHLPVPDCALSEIERVLKKDGVLYLTVPQSWCLHYEPHDYFRFTKYGIQFLLEKNGLQVFSVERIGGFFSLIGQRSIDFIWQAIVNVFSTTFSRNKNNILRLRWAERIAAFVCGPASFILYHAGSIADGLEQRDALGWAVLARK